MNRQEMQKMFDEFLDTLDDIDAEVSESVIRKFLEWKFAEEIAKEERYRQYLELHKEFGPKLHFEPK